MKIAIIGASGFVGRHLTDSLLANTKHQLVLFSHKATKLHYTPDQEERIVHYDGNILNPTDISQALQHCDMAVYLVHLMGHKKSKDFTSLEQQAAHNFADAVTAHKIQRVVYVGGMGDASMALTKHLQSRDATGAIIRAKVNQLIELRTPMIIGPGGAGFEVLTTLVRRMPVLPVPRWARAVTQPITVHDVVRYITASLMLKTTQHVALDIGGPEQLTYIQVAERYAAHTGKRLITMPLPLAPKSLTKFGLRQFKTSGHAATVADMLDSAGYSALIDDSVAKKLFPAIKPETIEAAF